jgi:hypothetical protein
MSSSLIGQDTHIMLLTSRDVRHRRFLPQCQATSLHPLIFSFLFTSRSLQVIDPSFFVHES